MGYRYGERRYGEGLYSSWPDNWRLEECKGSSWTEQTPTLVAASTPLPTASFELPAQQQQSLRKQTDG